MPFALGGGGVADAFLARSASLAARADAFKSLASLEDDTSTGAAVDAVEARSPALVSTRRSRRLLPAADTGAGCAVSGAHCSHSVGMMKVTLPFTKVRVSDSVSTTGEPPDAVKDPSLDPIDTCAPSSAWPARLTTTDPTAPVTLVTTPFITAGSGSSAPGVSPTIDPITLDAPAAKLLACAGATIPVLARDISASAARPAAAGVRGAGSLPPVMRETRFTRPATSAADESADSLPTTDDTAPMILPRCSICFCTAAALSASVGAVPFAPSPVTPLGARDTARTLNVCRAWSMGRLATSLSASLVIMAASAEAGGAFTSMSMYVSLPRQPALVSVMVKAIRTYTIAYDTSWLVSPDGCRRRLHTRRLHRRLHTGPLRRSTRGTRWRGGCSALMWLWAQLKGRWL